MILTIIFTGLLFYFLGQNLPIVLGNIVTKIQNEKILSKIRPTEIRERELCTEPHQWIDAPKSLDDNGDFIYTNVCENCGFIPGMSMMASEEGLKQIILNRDRIDKDEKIRDEFIEKEEALMKKVFAKELENGLEFGKLTQIYFAGQTLKERLILFRQYKMLEETDKAESADDR